MMTKKKRGSNKQKEYDILVCFKSQSGDEGKESGFFFGVKSGDGKNKWCILIGLLSASSHLCRRIQVLRSETTMHRYLRTALNEVIK